MIRVLCPYCKRRYRTERSALGVIGVCSACHRAFKIGQELAPFEWQQKDLAEDSWIGVKPPEEKKEIRHCIMCEAPLPEGSVSCPACGVNQVTGVVHRPKTEPVTSQPKIWSVLPIRTALTMALIAVVAVGAAWLFYRMYEAVIKSTEEGARHAKIMDGANFLRTNDSERAFLSQFAGYVDDTDMPKLLAALSAKKPAIARSARLLIGCGKITRLAPLLEWGEQAPNRTELKNILDIIGPRRLVELSNQEAEDARRSAARSLCILFDLPEPDKKIEDLARPMIFAEKTELLNRHFRTWPMLTGAFVVNIDGTVGNFEVHLEQIGTVFYLHIGSRMFRSDTGRGREVTIPIEYWCAATAPAVGAEQIRSLLDGHVVLTSPTGAEWIGTVFLTVKQPLLTNLPGFLPFDPPASGQTVEKPVRLERPGGR